MDFSYLAHTPLLQYSPHRTAFISRRFPPQGASTQVWAATAPEVEGVGGKYYSSCAEGYLAPHITPEEAERLWGFTEKLANIKFEI